jgi:hypothetical protein
MMKEEILKRAMFAMPLSKEARGTGIMSGFDMDDMGEMEDDVDQNADMESMPPMARTPQNPEILMNTLRGDMRSVDARYQELAQMVGEEAAMETPPEVLAMLMGQMGAQQQGIGALPQGQEMMPTDPGMMAPGAGMPPPDQMGAPQPAPAMPQGGIPMPEGMESAPPFSPGADAAPEGYAVGGIVRGAQFLGDKLGQYGARGAEAVSRGAQAANQYMGNLLMSPQPTLQRMTGGTPPMNLAVQGRETLLQSPAGTITQGVGTRAAPYFSMGPLTAPTFTQGISTAVAQGAERFPRAAQALKNMFPVAGLAAGAIQSIGGREQVSPADAAEEMRRQALLSQIPTEGYPAAPMRPGEPPRQAPPAAPQAAPAPSVVTEAAVAEAPSDDPLGAFITEKLSAFDKRQEGKGKTLAQDLKTAVKEKSKMDRIRESQAEYAPLYEELLGSDKESAKINALLLLSEAGLKLTTTNKPTFAMALADAASGLPRGFAAIAAQERELGMKVKAASLQQAISDVDAQDKYAQALKLQVLKGDYDLLKEQAKLGGNLTEDGGMGLRVTKTKQGTFVGTGIDPNDPTVKSAVQSRFTLRDTDNPFVENRGQAPTTIETDKAERIKLGNTLRSLDNSLSTLDNLKGVYTSAYGPSTWFSDKVNNLLVPVDPTGLVKPNFDTADAATRISTGMNSLLKSIASANDGGRVAVQEQEWVRETAKGISNPTAFFADKELAAKQFGSMEAMLRNARQQALTQLGYEGNDYVMRTPNTGTKNDPFIISSDPAQQKPMFTFLSSTIGRLQDPRAVVHLRMPNGTVQQFNPTQLRALNQ